MTGVHLFLMAFGAVMAVIGVIVFFLLAWFKETTGQEHHNAIKILQAEFRFSNPALVIFAGGLLLMVSPLFLGQAMPGQASPVSPQPTSPPVASPTLASPAAASQPATQPPAAGIASNIPPVVTQAPPTPVAAPTDTPTPTPTAIHTPTPLPAFTPPDPTGRWRNQNGFLEFRRLRGGEFVYTDFDNFGNQVGQGTASQDEDTLYIDGEGLIFNGFGYSYYTYTGEVIVEDNVLEGDLYDVFGNYLGPVFFTRDSGS